MSRRKKAQEIAEGDEALTRLLARLPDNPTTVAIRSYVEHLRLEAIRPRPRPRTREGRLRRDLDDAEIAYLVAKEQGSTQAMVSAQRQRREIQAELDAYELEQLEQVQPKTLPELSKLLADEFPTIYLAAPEEWKEAIKAIKRESSKW